MYPGTGALGGIYSGLFFSSYPFAFVSACDMPFIREEAIRRLISLKQGFDVVIPERETGVEPMHAIYSKNCLKPIRSQLDKNSLKIIDFFPQVRVRKVPAQELTGGEKDNAIFFNINTRQDLRWAEEHLAKGKKNEVGSGSPFLGKTL
jgi:molybdopterin-guanine dinucleotide biosynthesis protein A